jgi:hypothetical protein
MKSYALDAYGLTKGSIICGNITLMRKRMHGKLSSIKKAPNRYDLKVFGGTMTIDEFRQNVDVDGTPVNTIETEKVKDHTVPFISNTKKMNEIKNTGDGLLLKREKPLQRNQNSLEAALGIVVTPPRTLG